MSEPKIYKPSIYNGNGVYNNGAGGGNVPFPDDITLFEILHINSSVSNLFDAIQYDDTNENVSFICKHKIVSHTGDIYLFSKINENPGCSFYFYLSPVTETVTRHHVQNCPVNGIGDVGYNLNPSDVIGVLKCLELKNSVVKSYFTQTNIKTGINYNIGTVSTIYPFHKILGSIDVYNFAIKKDSSITYNLVPAKKMSIIGLFDSVNMVFYPASNQSVVSLENQII